MNLYVIHNVNILFLIQIHIDGEDIDIKLIIIV